ncbi:hypothetical protein EST62_02885 [Chlorobaculum sp. 24CR]|uniref:hypothetical protein n=1 Tax=Chlorobaculum sp. 24CR TaxID=2508878 RepID=UPI00100A3941|nr:hypothetical protein [Chlorobaculum sp. 24CR]RXK88469.1 hypothetical protein EST62_02885 [Chlorobaculum sp. 24CR]
MYYHHVLRYLPAGFPDGLMGLLRQKSRQPSAVTTTASFMDEVRKCGERSRESIRILVKAMRFTILPARRFHLFITVMTDEML